MATEKIAEFIVQTKYDKLPTAAREAAKSAILDTIGCALAGSREEGGRKVLSLVREFGGRPVASVIGGGFRTSPVMAALANGTLSHELDYDDLNGTYGHPSTVAVPTALAMGEKCKSSGKDIITAYVIGLEVGFRLGEVLGRPHYDKGWHTTSTVGSLRGLAAAAKLLKLDAQETIWALGIAASLAAGLRENFGTMTKPLHAGNAARNAVLAALLAKKGFTANEAILEGRYGFMKTFGEGIEYDLDEMCRHLGSPFSVVSPGIWAKAYACCAGNHASIDAALELRKGHSFKPNEIAEIECATGPDIPKLLVHHRPKTGLEAKFSLEYNVAAALVDGEVTLSHFTDERVANPVIQGLIPKVKYTHPPELVNKKGLTDLPRTVTVRLRNGKTYSGKALFPKGDPRNPMSREELSSKFRQCAEKVLSQKNTTRVIDMVSHLEKLDGITDLMGILAGNKRKRQ